jgi:hypothetical protein
MPLLNGRAKNTRSTLQHLAADPLLPSLLKIFGTSCQQPFSMALKCFPTAKNAIIGSPIPEMVLMILS